MLTDRFGRIHDYLRVSVTDRCNLRCVYCMPPVGLEWKPREQILRLAEIARVIGIMAGLGVRKVRLNGGEPTVRSDIERLIQDIAAIPGVQTVAMTTNGILFAARAARLKSAGLTSVNISLDSLNSHTFAQITRRNEFENVLRSIDRALEAGFAPLKINTVIMPGVNDHELLDFVHFIKDKPVNVRFIEYMPFKGNHWDDRGYVPASQMKALIDEHYDLLPLIGNYTENRIATDYAIPGFLGTVSFIASLSESFCDRCSRLRLTADGALKACLFFPAQVQLRDALRSGADDSSLIRLIEDTVQAKPKGHPSVEELEAVNDLSMIQIGG